MSIDNGVFSVNAEKTLTLTVLDSAGNPKDISDATTIEYVLRKHDQTIAVLTASFVTDGTDGDVKYKFVSGNLPVEGKYEVQVKLVAPTWEDQSTTYEFFVRETFA